MVQAQIIVDIGFGLGLADAHVLGEGEGGDAVDDAEVDGLGAAAHLGRDGVKGHVEDLGGRDPVDVRAGVEGGLHGGVPGHVGQDPELDLAVIRVHEDAARGRDEHLTDLRP